MAAIQESAVRDQSSPPSLSARQPGHSPVFRVLGAILVLAISLGLAWLARAAPDSAAQMLAIMLVGLGGLLAWKFLPLPAKARTRLAAARAGWQEDNRRLGDSWARVLRAGLWLGPFTLFLKEFDEFWKTGTLRFPPSHAWISAGAIFAIGLIALLCCRRGRQVR